jgi:hypothetical protein
MSFSVKGGSPLFVQDDCKVLEVCEIHDGSADEVLLDLKLETIMEGIVNDVLVGVASVHEDLV